MHSPPGFDDDGHLGSEALLAENDLDLDDVYFASVKLESLRAQRARLAVQYEALLHDDAPDDTTPRPGIRSTHPPPNPHPHPPHSHPHPPPVTTRGPRLSLPKSATSPTDLELSPSSGFEGSPSSPSAALLFQHAHGNGGLSRGHGGEVASANDYLRHAFRKFNGTAVAAKRRDAVAVDVPTLAHKMVDAEAEFFFGKSATSLRCVALQSHDHLGHLDDVKIAHEAAKYGDQSVDGGRTWKDWWGERVMVNRFPVGSSNEERLAIYFDRRTLPSYKVVGLGVGAVITGEFAGWNTGIVEGGFGGLMTSTWLAGLMYLCLILSLAEMALSIPVVGGNFAFSRAIGGNWLGFLVGHSECIEYVMFLSLVLVGVSETVCEMLDIDHRAYAPAIWLAFILICVAIMLSARAPWDVMAILNVVCVVQIIGYCVMVGVFSWDPSQITEGLEEDPTYATPGKSSLFPSGAVGVLNALPAAIWWYTGVEVVALAGTEVRDERKTTPRGLVISWLTLFLSALALSTFTLMSVPGAAAIGEADYPMVATMVAVFGPGMRKIGLALMFPAFLTNGIAMLWAASRQMVPMRSVIFVSVYAYLMAGVGVYLEGLIGSVDPAGVLLDLTILSAIMTYIGVAYVYILFHFRHPDAPRPYRSPFGWLGGVFLLLMCCLIVIEQLVTSTDFEITMVTYVVKMLIGGSFFVINGKSHLLPTEDALIFTFWAKEKEKKILAFADKERTGIRVMAPPRVDDSGHLGSEAIHAENDLDLDDYSATVQLESLRVRRALLSLQLDASLDAPLPHATRPVQPPSLPLPPLTSLCARVSHGICLPQDATSPDQLERSPSSAVLFPQDNGLSCGHGGEVGSAGDYLRHTFGKFNGAAVAAQRRDAVADDVPAQAHKMVDAEAGFFFGKSATSLRCSALRSHEHLGRTPEEELKIAKEIVAFSDDGLGGGRTWKDWWGERVMVNTFPVGSSNEERLAIYFERRTLPSYKASLFQVVGLGVSAVITGEFAGWNTAVAKGGFGGLMASTCLAGLMYLCLVLSLAEMALSIPVLGGNFAFSRAIGGNWLGFLVGHSECIEYGREEISTLSI
ncbi:hypothetical protein HK101_009003 [Irineochytrium annulatum]|nr:hypothetical protein HK101_009003 [Irineochytrium annulatum]